MKKILLVPLDERPCCFEFQEQMAKDTDIRIIKPPRSLLPDKKKFADPEKLFAWMEENADGCDGAHCCDRRARLFRNASLAHS